MATFPATIPWDTETSLRFDYGATSVVMEDGTANVESLYSGAVDRISGTVVHKSLSHAEMISVRDFLRDNVGVDFDVTDQSRDPPQAMSGKCVSEGLDETFVGAGVYNVRWDFRGEEV